MSKESGSAGGAAASTPAETPTFTRAIDDPILSALAQDMEAVIKSEKDGGEGDVPEIKPADETPSKAEGEEGEKKAEKVEAGATPETPSITVRKRSDRVNEIADSVARKVASRLPLPPKPAAEEVAAPEKPKPAPAPAATEELAPEQVDEIADAEYAEKLDPAKFKGMASKIRAFYKSVDEYVAKHKAEDPDRTFDKDDEEFIRFVERSKPNWHGQRDRVRIERIADARAEAKIREREAATENRLSDVQREAKEAKLAPVIDREIASFRNEYDATTKTDDPLETEVYSDFRGSAEQLVVDYLRVLNGVDAISEKNPKDLQARHQWLVGFVMNRAEDFASSGGNDRVRDGRTFVTPTKFSEMIAAKDPNIAKHWTFTQSDVIREIRNHAVASAKSEITRQVKEAERRGFVRRQAKTQTQSANSTPPKPVAGLRTTTTPAPGANATGADINDGTHPGKEIVDILGLK